MRIVCEVYMFVVVGIEGYSDLWLIVKQQTYKGEGVLLILRVLKGSCTVKNKWSFLSGKISFVAEYREHLGKLNVAK